MVAVAKKRGENRIAYIDLFAGPGRFGDEYQSTPLQVLRMATQEPDLCRMLVTFFNDKNPDYARSLEEIIDSTPEFGQLRHKPQVANDQVGEEIVAEFEKTKMIPTLFFVDPWGYKGLSLRLINSVLRNWGSDCIIFFNYNRIRMGLTNPLVREHMDALFGPDRAEDLRERLMGLTLGQAELEIVEQIAEALKSMGGRYVLPFRFRDERGSRTSHHLIFVSKDFKGYEIMKDIMSRESTTTNQGVPSFEYNPATRDYPLLFELSRPLDELRGQLVHDFAGRTLTMRKIYEAHSVDRPFLARHYKETLIKLEAEGAIEADPPSSSRRKNTFADRVSVTFPSSPLKRYEHSVVVGVVVKRRRRASDSAYPKGWAVP